MFRLPFRLLLGSQSPRRKEILQSAGFVFTPVQIDYEEHAPEGMAPEDLPSYLAGEKAMHGRHYLQNDDVLLTADTLVFLNDKPIGKPANRADAVEMLENLSGKTHTVITGVCLMSLRNKVVFDDRTQVTFRVFDMKELEYYVDHYSPMDKAGAYGVQDWLGMVGIEGMEGSFYNVMGLPIHKVYDHLKSMAETEDFVYKPWKT